MQASRCSAVSCCANAVCETHSMVAAVRITRSIGFFLSRLRLGKCCRGSRIGVILLLLNFLDGLYQLAKLDWHVAYRVAPSVCYIVLSVRLMQLILAFRGE